MTYEEVLKNANDEIENATDFYNSLEDNAQKEMVHYAIDGWTLIKNAVEKQIPKKPIDYEKIDCEKDDGFYHCPVCDMQIGTMQEYCERCGQKIDWSEEQ